ncbi:MAG: 3-hydroxy-5-phosphonooxypentane-2,4-dione thiolase, partial [Acidimicrobiales bacterium]
GRRCLFLAIDHGYFLGPTSSLEKPGETITPLAPYAEALFVTRGVLRSAIPADIGTSIILRISGGSSITGTLENESITTSVEEAVRVGADAVGVSVFVGSDHEHQTLMNLAEAVNDYERYGIPVMAVTAVGKELEKRDTRYLAMSCRIAAELGARVVKTYYCENFDQVTESCPVPVVMAGGPRTSNDLEVLEFVSDGIHRGAAGVNLGRNVWQHDHPEAMAEALRAVIHDDARPSDAIDIVRRAESTA